MVRNTTNSKMHLKCNARVKQSRIYVSLNYSQNKNTYFIKTDTKRNGCKGRVGERVESGIMVKPQIPYLWLPDLIVQRYSHRLWSHANLDLNLNFSVSYLSNLK